MNRLPFTVKICGITMPADAQLAARAGADAIGLNFYARSNRFVTCEQAKQIAAAVPAGVLKVGVFVNASVEEITAAITATALDMVQLHGDEPPEFLAQLRKENSLPIMRALCWGPAQNLPIDKYLAHCGSLNCPPQMLLLDSQTEGQFGGTGTTADWQKIAQWQERRSKSIPLVLAGGLTSQNVAAAIAAVRPDAVDTASGVESSPGCKDAALVQAFIAAARNVLNPSPS